MPQMQAIVRLPAKNIAPGDKFEATDKQAKLLLGLGLAKVVPLRAARQPRAPKPAPALTADKPKRAYRRRDMRAEG